MLLSHTFSRFVKTQILNILLIFKSNKRQKIYFIFKLTVKYYIRLDQDLNIPILKNALISKNGKWNVLYISKQRDSYLGVRLILMSN